MPDPEALRMAILERLSIVIDPETGVDVVRMRLVENLNVDKDGYVTYTFHPSSPLCPLAVPLSLDIRSAVAEVPGVNGQGVDVVGFVLADELIDWLKDGFEKQQQSKAEGSR